MTRMRSKGVTNGVNRIAIVSSDKVREDMESFHEMRVLTADV